MSEQQPCQQPASVGSEEWTAAYGFIIAGDEHLHVGTYADAKKIADAHNAALRKVQSAPVAGLEEKLNPAFWTVVDESSKWTLAEAVEMHRRKAEQVLSLQTELEQAKAVILEYREVVLSKAKGGV